jgi:outer membrane beta-barrel protein
LIVLLIALFEQGETGVLERLNNLMNGRLAVGVAVLIGLGLTASSAYAQKGGSMETPGSPDADARTDDEFDRRLDQYWAADRELPVIKQKRFERGGRVEFGLMGGIMTTEPFYKYYPVGARATYYLSDYFGIELEGSYAGGPLRSDSDLTNFLNSPNGAPGFNEDTDTMDRLKWRADILASWSPFYGKFAFLQRKLAHFDLNFSAGLGVVSVDRPNEGRTAGTTATAPELVLGVGGHFYLSKRFVLRLDGRGYLYQGAKAPTNSDSTMDQLNAMSSFMAGIGYLF